MKVFINKVICKFLFLHDLSGWHYSARGSFRDYWIRTPSKLTKKEQTALAAWQKLNADFYKKKKDFILGNYLSGKLNKHDRKTILSTFEILGPRFEFHYQQQLPNMKKVAAYLRKFKGSRHLEKTHKLYGIKDRNLPIYLAMSHNANKSAGGMRLGSFVILQFGDYKLKKDNSTMLNVLSHELTHGGSVSRYLSAKPNIKLPRLFTGDTKDFIDEVIHKALWSEIGLFSQKQFGWSDQKVEKSYRFLLEKSKDPHKEIIKKAFGVRDYLAEKFRNSPDFKFSPSSAREIVSIIEENA